MQRHPPLSLSHPGAQLCGLTMLYASSLLHPGSKKEEDGWCDVWDLRDAETGPPFNGQGAGRSVCVQPGQGEGREGGLPPGECLRKRRKGQGRKAADPGMKDHFLFFLPPDSSPPERVSLKWNRWHSSERQLWPRAGPLETTCPTPSESILDA